MQTLRRSNTYRERLQTALHEVDLPLMPLQPTIGPQVVRIPIPLCGIPIDKLAKKSEEIALRFALKDVIVEQLEGTTLAAVQIARAQGDREIVLWRDAVESPAFVHSDAELPVILGVDVDGNVVVRDLVKAPHVSMGGVTGGGKSNSATVILCGIMIARSPAEVRIIIVEPKTDFAGFRGLPHLLEEVVHDDAEGVAMLERVTEEMDNRNELFRALNVRDLKEYNASAQKSQRLPRILVYVDEFADIMITSEKEIAKPMQRLLQKGRSSGIHVIIATQQLKKELIPTTLTTNTPTRIAFMTSRRIDSDLILGEGGAESLLGLGDMLVRWGGGARLIRLQAPNIEAEDLADALEHIRTAYSRPATGWLEPQPSQPTGADIHKTPLPSRGINRPAPKPEKSADEKRADTIEAWIREHAHESVTQTMVQDADDLSIGWRTCPAALAVLVERGVIGEYDASAKHYPVLAGLEPREESESGI